MIQQQNCWNGNNRTVEVAKQCFWMCTASMSKHAGRDTGPLPGHCWCLIDRFQHYKQARHNICINHHQVLSTTRTAGKSCKGCLKARRH